MRHDAQNPCAGQPDAAGVQRLGPQYPAATRREPTPTQEDQKCCVS